MSFSSAISQTLNTMLRREGKDIVISYEGRQMTWRAMPGQMPQMRYDNEGRKYRMTYVNWCGRVDALNWEDGTPFEPTEDYQITEIDTVMNVTRLYKVVSPGGEEQPARFMDQYRVGYRVHCVLISEDPIA